MESRLIDRSVTRAMACALRQRLDTPANNASRGESLSAVGRIARATPAAYRADLVDSQASRSITIAVEVVEQPAIRAIDTHFQRNLGPSPQLP